MGATASQFITATGASVSSLSAVFSSAVSSGNSIMVLVGNWRDNVNVRDLSTIADNSITAAFTNRIFSTQVGDTNVHLRMYDKLNISSGRAASTYRVTSSAVAGGVGMNCSWCAIEYSGGPFTFASTASQSGTSTGPNGGALTASSTPVLFLSAGAYNASITGFNSTLSGSGNHITTVDPTNAAQVLNVIQSTVNSSLQQNPTHSLNTSTRWSAATVLYLGLGGGGGAVDYPNPWMMSMMGVQ